MPLERNLLASVERLLKARGITYRKRHGTAFGIKGDPDLYLVWRGTHVEIELKRIGEEPTKLQRARLAEWERAGALTAVIHSTEELHHLLAQLIPKK